MSAFLRNLWYFAIPGGDVGRGRIVGLKLLGEPIAIGRAHDGSVFALRDLCPHRGMPLSHGTVENDGVRCCFHGWKFSLRDGRCLDIPSFDTTRARRIDRIGVATYPCRETQGNIWIYFGAATLSETDAQALPDVPAITGFGDAKYKARASFLFDVDMDQATFGLLDPAHVPHVHVSWWARRKKLHPIAKEKAYEPFGNGFRLVPHRPKAGAFAHMILGRNTETEITFELPGTRIEYIRGDRHSLVILLVTTPADEHSTRVHVCLYWDAPYLDPFRPLVQRAANTFIGQDRDIARKHSEGLAHDPPMMLIDDADTLMKWYLRLKKEWHDSVTGGRPFENPIRPQTLRYRT